MSFEDLFSKFQLKRAIKWYPVKGYLDAELDFNQEPSSHWLASQYMSFAVLRHVTSE